LQVGLISIPARGNDTAAPCCADLEQLLSGLTAALSRSENSERTLRLYGQLNRALLFWDDGNKSRGYAVDNETSSSRLGLIGRHRLPGELSAGYRIEIASRVTSSSEVSSGDPLGDLGDGAIRLRHAYWCVDDSKLGRLTFGQQSPATDDITLINLGSEMNNAALHYNNSFALRIASPGVFRLTWGDLAHTVDSFRGLFVRYDTPAVHGFLVSVAAGEDQTWDAALRYSTDWNSVRVAAGIGFMQNDALDFRDVRGSLSALHLPTGLFVSLAGGLRDDDGVALDADRNGHFYFAQAGLSRRFLSFGNTTIYGEYGRYEDFSVGKVFRANLTGADRRWALTDTNV
jgi:predicted porin